MRNGGCGMKAPTTLSRSVRVFNLHSPLVAWRTVMPENRLGMIVCGAFLGLVTAVVIAKMHEATPAADKAVVVAEPAAASPKAETATPPPAAKPEPASTAPRPTPHSDEIALPEPTSPAPPRPPAPTAPSPATDLPPLPEPPAARVASKRSPHVSRRIDAGRGELCLCQTTPCRLRRPRRPLVQCSNPCLRRRLLQRPAPRINRRKTRRATARPRTIQKMIRILIREKGQKRKGTPRQGIFRIMG